MKKYLFSIVLSVSTIFVIAQSTKDAAVEIWAKVQAAPPTVTLNWVGNGTTNNYAIAKKLKTASTWSNIATGLSGTTTSYVDNNVTVGTNYEYRIIRSGTTGTVNYQGFGYINAGIEIPVVENRGRLILLVANTMTSSLATEIARLETDLEGDGWDVVRLVASTTASASQVKTQITTAYNQNPTNTKALFILGPVPIPYSGNICPDAHTNNHQGAWPADCYYGDINGTWTDATVTAPTTGPTRIHNVPGDGKFDQSFIPSPMELQVGRVDLRGMTTFTAFTETQLLKNYLDKDHDYRKKVFAVQRRAIIDDNFGYFSGEAFAANGWKNFGPICTPSNVTAGDYITSMTGNSYQWSYGCGGGSYTSASGIGTTTDLSNSNLQGIFTVLFGSYFGDWDNNNNFLRAPLCQGKTLTNAWAGRPHWMFHHMALGETIGYSTVISQNNTGSVYFASPFGGLANSIHIALMGDPSLRNEIVSPVSNVVATKNGNNCNITWTASTQTNVIGYNIYMKNDTNKTYVKINPTTITGTSYTHQCLVYPGIYKYMVRALVLENTPSGTYYNMSEGIMDTAMNTVNLAIYANAGAAVSGTSSSVSFTSTAIGGTVFAWSFGDGGNSSQQNPVHTYTANGNYTATLVVSNSCNSVTLTVPVGITTGIYQEQFENALSVFPNPSNGKVNVLAPKEMINSTEVFVYSQDGKLVYQTKLKAESTEINLQNQAKGIYFMQLRDINGNTSSRKIIIE